MSKYFHNSAYIRIKAHPCDLIDYAGTGLGGDGGQFSSFKNFYLYVTATINSMKITFSDV